MATEKLLVTWQDLVDMGWPYSRSHTYRMMSDAVPDFSDLDEVGEPRLVPNPDPFPKCAKLTPHRNSHPMWVRREVITYFKAHGLNVS
jgi:hypothetical protein